MRANEVAMKRTRLILCTAAVLEACASDRSATFEGGQANGDPTTTNPDGGSTTEPAPKVKATHFSDTGSVWNLPSRMSAISTSFVDVDGDGWLDALGRDDFDENDADHRRFARNDGKAFASVVTKYAFPDGGNYQYSADFDGDRVIDRLTLSPLEVRKGSLVGLGGPIVWDASAIAQATSLIGVNLDGDHLPDFFVLKAGANGTAATFDVVHAQSGGFGPVERWTRPAGAPDALSAYFRDFDGDGRDDLAEFPNPEKKSFNVWRNNGTDFDTTPIAYRLPATCYCASKKGDPAFELVDLDGDGKLDLVEPADYASFDDQKTFFLQAWGIAEGKPHWKYYPNEGHGFAEVAREWPIPKRPGENVAGFNRVGHSSSLGGIGNGSVPEWKTVDFNGDGLPDLVDVSDRGTGYEYQRVVVYFGTP
jgi:hypothetical protein